MSRVTCFSMRRAWTARGSASSRAMVSRLCCRQHQHQRRARPPWTMGRKRTRGDQAELCSDDRRRSSVFERSDACRSTVGGCAARGGAGRAGRLSLRHGSRYPGGPRGCVARSTLARHLQALGMDSSELVWGAGDRASQGGGGAPEVSRRGPVVRSRAGVRAERCHALFALIDVASREVPVLSPSS